MNVGMHHAVSLTLMVEEAVSRGGRVFIIHDQEDEGCVFFEGCVLLHFHDEPCGIAVQAH
jgi:hypothetical protein